MQKISVWMGVDLIKLYTFWVFKYLTKVGLWHLQDCAETGLVKTSLNVREVV